MKQPPRMQYTPDDAMRSIHPQGWVPVETHPKGSGNGALHGAGVAFTPKGGCPLKRYRFRKRYDTLHRCSIHPQGWVPVETGAEYLPVQARVHWFRVAFTPKGGCPLKLATQHGRSARLHRFVAFTPKGGCPLKPGGLLPLRRFSSPPRSIHPQGWVPVETDASGNQPRREHAPRVAFTPKGGCPLKPHSVYTIFL